MAKLQDVACAFVFIVWYWSNTIPEGYLDYRRWTSSFMSANADFISTAGAFSIKDSKDRDLILSPVNPQHFTKCLSVFFRSYEHNCKGTPQHQTFLQKCRFLSQNPYSDSTGTKKKCVLVHSMHEMGWTISHFQNGWRIDTSYMLYIFSKSYKLLCGSKKWKETSMITLSLQHIVTDCRNCNGFRSSARSTVS